MGAMPDPYATLGVTVGATDAELRAAYRRLVQLHHPDHNGGSAESARRFEQVQEAYAEARRLRQAGPRRGRGARGAGGANGARGAQGASGAGGPAADPSVDARLAAMEQELRSAREARERAREAERVREHALRDARAAAAATGARPSDAELGYISTDDSFSKILDDLAAEVSGRVSEARESPAGHRVSDLIDELADKLTGERHRRK
jgi:curved DNA-binding protein CbpA